MIHGNKISTKKINNLPRKFLFFMALLVLGGLWTTTLAATGQTGTLTINKVCVPGNDAGKFNLSANTTAIFDVPCGGTTGPITVNAGSVQVGEAAGTGTDAAFYRASINCGAGITTCQSANCGGVATNVPANGNVTCTITNTYAPCSRYSQMSSIPVQEVIIQSTNNTGAGTIYTAPQTGTYRIEASSPMGLTDSDYQSYAWASWPVDNIARFHGTSFFIIKNSLPTFGPDTDPTSQSLGGQRVNNFSAYVDSAKFDPPYNNNRTLAANAGRNVGTTLNLNSGGYMTFIVNSIKGSNNTSIPGDYTTNSGQIHVCIGMTSSSQMLMCNPSSQTINSGGTANITASGGSGSYTWSAPAGSPASGSGPAFAVSYTNGGGSATSSTVTLSDGMSSTQCTVITNPGTPMGCNSSNQCVAGGDGGSCSSSPCTYNPTPPFADNLSVATSSCTGTPGSGLATFSWKYNDVLGHNESKFQFEMTTASDTGYASPVINRTFSGLSNAPGTTNQQAVSIYQTVVSDAILYNTAYIWRVKVWDSNNIASVWADGGSYQKFGHPDPVPGFTFSPSNPVPVGSPVNFTNTSICYNNIGQTACISYAWNFGDTGCAPQTSCTTSTLANPTHTYNSVGSFNAILKAYDDVGFCQVSQTITAQIGTVKGCNLFGQCVVGGAGATCATNSQCPGSLPSWKEISPF